MSPAEAEEVQAAAVMDATRDAIEQGGEASRTEAVEIFHTPSELGKAFLVPQMEVFIEGEHLTGMIITSMVTMNFSKF